MTDAFWKMTDYYVTVCATCMRASCWQGEMYCDDYKAAGTKEVLSSVLASLGNEHESYFAPERLIAVCGQLRLA